MGGIASSAVCRVLGSGAGGLTMSEGCAMGDFYSFDKGMVRSRLIRWGEWKMKSGVALGFPKQASFMNLSGVRGTEAVSFLDEVDSECAQTNGAVELLPFVHLAVVRVEYVLAYKDTAVKAHSCGISKRSYYNYLEAAHKLVAKNLNLLLHDVHEFDINALSCSEVCLAH